MPLRLNVKRGETAVPNGSGLQTLTSVLFGVTLGQEVGQTCQRWNKWEPGLIGGALREASQCYASNGPPWGNRRPPPQAPQQLYLQEQIHRWNRKWSRFIGETTTWFQSSAQESIYFVKYICSTYFFYLTYLIKDPMNLQLVKQVTDCAMTRFCVNYQWFSQLYIYFTMRMTLIVIMITDVI